VNTSREVSKPGSVRLEQLERVVATLELSESDIDRLARGLRPGTCGWVMDVLRERQVREEPMTWDEAHEAAAEWV